MILDAASLHSGRLVARKYLARGALLWLAVRLLLSVVVLMAALNPFDLSLLSSLAIVLLTTVLGLLEILRQHEFVLLRNLAVSRQTIALLCGAPAVVGETIVQLAGLLTR